MHRRVASQSKWKYQEQGALVLQKMSRLKECQRRCATLRDDLQGMSREQLQWQETGYFDGAQREAVLRLMGEVNESLLAWEAAADKQIDEVRRARLDLARAKQRKEKSEEKYQAALRELREAEESSSDRELEDIYINTYRHPSRVAKR